MLETLTNVVPTEVFLRIKRQITGVPGHHVSPTFLDSDLSSGGGRKESVETL